MKILVVEDDPVSRAVIANVLREQGHDVYDAWRADEALRLVAELEPDLLVADWRLNDHIDGIDIAKAARAVNPRIQVLLMSAYQPMHQEIVRKGIIPDIVLDKPVGLEKMVAAISLAITHLAVEA